MVLDFFRFCHNRGIDIDQSSLFLIGQLKLLYHFGRLSSLRTSWQSPDLLLMSLHFCISNERPCVKRSNLVTALYIIVCK